MQIQLSYSLLVIRILTDLFNQFPIGILVLLLNNQRSKCCLKRLSWRSGCVRKRLAYFSSISYVVLIFTALIYWCVHKETGTYLLMGWSGNRVVNGVIKVAGCVYRPWIRDARVAPEANALATATGYSFPSGHSMNGASLFGGMAIRKGIKTGFRVVLWIMR